MFASVAPRYDLLNRLLSLNIDQFWRGVTRKKLGKLLGEEPLILDLCSGTGDLAIELSRLGPVVGCDFCHPMLVRGVEKARRKNLQESVFFSEGDALELPFKTNEFDAVSIAFGLRNLEDYIAGLREMRRVLRPGGFIAILEFSIPSYPVIRPLYLFYFTRILPRIGALVSGRDGPYSYLPESVQEFPQPAELGELLRNDGFGDVQHTTLTGGIATLTLATRQERSISSSLSP